MDLLGYFLYIYKMMITRFLQVVVEATLTRSPAIAILGPRQVGKTTLARTIAGKKKRVSLFGY